MSDKLFNLAVSLIRRGNVSFPDILREIESAGSAGVDAMAVYAAANSYARETQETAFQCSVEAFKKGESFSDVCKKLEACGFHSWDSSIVAGRAKHTADTELAQETKSE